jgi:hypothetical protein
MVKTDVVALRRRADERLTRGMLTATAPICGTSPPSRFTLKPS